jgi:hypothetical protein
LRTTNRASSSHVEHPLTSIAAAKIADAVPAWPIEATTMDAARALLSKSVNIPMHIIYPLSLIQSTKLQWRRKYKLKATISNTTAAAPGEHITVVLEVKYCSTETILTNATDWRRQLYRPAIFTSG